jgi:hypothetical protein
MCSVYITTHKIVPVQLATLTKWKLKQMAFRSFTMILFDFTVYWLDMREKSHCSKQIFHICISTKSLEVIYY